MCTLFLLEIKKITEKYTIQYLKILEFNLTDFYELISDIVPQCAEVVKSVDTSDSKSDDFTVVRVQFPLSVPSKIRKHSFSILQISFLAYIKSS
jgi:hypothetical protein